VLRLLLLRYDCRLQLLRVDGDVTPGAIVTGGCVYYDLLICSGLRVTVGLRDCSEFDTLLPPRSRSPLRCCCVTVTVTGCLRWCHVTDFTILVDYALLRFVPFAACALLRCALIVRYVTFRCHYWQRCAHAVAWAATCLRLPVSPAHAEHHLPRTGPPPAKTHTLPALRHTPAWLFHGLDYSSPAHWFGLLRVLILVLVAFTYSGIPICDLGVPCQHLPMLLPATLRAVPLLLRLVKFITPRLTNILRSAG